MRPGPVFYGDCVDVGRMSLSRANSVKVGMAPVVGGRSELRPIYVTTAELRMCLAPSWPCYALHLPFTLYHEGFPLCWSPVHSPGLPKIRDVNLPSRIDPTVRLCQLCPSPICYSKTQWQNHTMVRRSKRGSSQPPCVRRNRQ
jgi:hypothetical protein